MTAPLPRPFGRYQLQSVLGEGGMARVYRAQLVGPSGFVKTLAVKLVHRDLTERDEAFRQALVTEARIGGLLKHPHIVDVYDFGEADGQHFVAMEWIDGVDGGDLLARGGPLTPRQALDVGVALLDALQYLHTLEGPDGPLDLVHRDLKPSNVLLGRRGEIKLMDFGIARGEGMSDARTATGIAKGSAPWMSPEQALAQPLDARSDLFSLGTVLFEFAAGRRFNDQPSITAVVAGLLSIEDRIVPGGELDGLDDLVPGLAGVVRRCLRRDPVDRYPAAQAVGAELRALRGALPEGEPLAARIERHLGTAPPSLSFDATEEVSADLLPTPAPGPSAPTLPDREPAAHAPRSRTPIYLGAAILFVLLGLVVRGPPADPTPPPGAPLPGMTSSLISASGSPEGEPGLSPDGTRVVFVRILEGERHFILKDLESEQERTLEAGDLQDLSQPTWSRDGKRLAFSARRPQAGLYTLAVDLPDAHPQRVSEDGVHPDFSPDGTRIAYSTEPIGRPLGKKGVSSLKLVDLTTLDRRTLLEGDANQPRWSPDGSRIAYWGTNEAAQRNVWTVDVATGEATPVTDGDAVDWNPVWAPDGEHLYFLSDRGGGSALHRVRVDPATGEPTGTPASLGGTLQALPGMLSIDATGRWIAFDTSLVEENVQLLELDAQGRTVGDPRWVTRGTRTVVWSEPSPGGDRVVWVEQHRSVEDLWIAATDGAPPVRLTDDPFRDRMPKWLDDHRIVFYSNRGGRWGLWLIHADGGEPMQIDPEGNTSTFVLSPDATTIATTLHDQPEVALLTVDEDGHERTRKRALFDRPPNLKPRPSSWSPDGTRLLLEATSAGGGGRWVAAWNPETGEVEEGRPEVSMLRWVTNDSVIGGQPDRVLRLAWPDGDPEVIHELPEGTTLGWLGLSSDRRFLTVHANRETTGIWRWELSAR